MKIDANTIIGEIVKVNYKTAQTFEAHNIDFCCGGGISLNEACKKAGINTNELIPKLEAMVQLPDADSKYIDGLELDELIDYILKRHHTYVLENMPFIQKKLQKLCDVHGENHPELYEIRQLFDGAVENLSAHMQKEENILFPHIKKMVNFKKENRKSDLISEKVLEPIHQMELEHSIEGERFASLVKLTNNYTCPADGCGTYQVTFKSLQDFELDLHRHIHLENNILFKKAVKLEEELTI